MYRILKNVKFKRRYYVKKIYYILYTVIAAYLPNSNAKILGKISSRIRRFLFKKITLNTSEGIGIQRGAKFTSDIKIGKYSNLGIRCVIGNNTIIGDYVMMGQMWWFIVLTMKQEKLIYLCVSKVLQK